MLCGHRLADRLGEENILVLALVFKTNTKEEN